MGAIITVGPDVDLPENPQLQELTHGGFRSSPYHQWMEDNCDPRHMGRDLLKRTEPLPTADTDGYDEVMAAASPQGSESKYRSSKWSG